MLIKLLGERTRISKSKKSGAGAAEVYTTKWPFWDSLKFLRNSIDDSANKRIDSLTPATEATEATPATENSAPIMHLV